MDGSAVDGGIPDSAMLVVGVDSTTENCDVVVVEVLRATWVEMGTKAEVVTAKKAVTATFPTDNFMIIRECETERRWY
jgi:hypothetical protein